MRVAHVGAERPYTQQDRFRRLQAMALVGPQSWNDAEEDLVNLLYGRDFLVEQETYDIVLVHSVFHTNHPPSLQATINDAVRVGPAQAIVPISPKHSLDAWRGRLVGTQAGHLLVFESQTLSLSAWNLGDLQGYALEFPDPRLGWYRRSA